jgi:hypothetical protein
MFIWYGLASSHDKTPFPLSMKNLKDIKHDQFAFRHARAASKLRCPSDLRLASKLRGANCGPAAYAATFECDVLDIMGSFPQFPRRPYTTTSQMISAFAGNGIDVRKCPGQFPTDGVALLQFIGPWGDETTTSSSALRRTHWVGVKGALLYDLNWGAWLPLISWEAIVFPMFTDFEPRIAGWSVRCGLQVETTPTKQERDQILTDRWPRGR